MNVSQIAPADWVDLCAVAIVVGGMALGAVRGFSGEFARLASALAALAAGIWARAWLGDWLVENSRLGEAAGPTAFVIAFVLALLGMALLRRLLRRFIRLIVEPPADSLLGIVAGGLQAVVLLALVFTISGWLPYPDLHRLLNEHARSGRWLAPATSRLNTAANEWPLIAMHMPDNPGTNNVENAQTFAEPPASAPSDAPFGEPQR